MIKNVYVKLILNLIFCSLVMMSCSKDYGVANLEEEIAIENSLNTSIDDTEKGDFSVILTKVEDSKSLVIKLIREIKGCGLKEAKDIVDNVPSVVLSNVKYSRAKEAKTQLEEVGAVAILQ